MKHADLERELAEIGGDLSKARTLAMFRIDAVAYRMVREAAFEAERRLAGLIATLDAEKDMETTK